MTDSHPQFERIVKGLNDLNWEQISFLQGLPNFLLHDSPPETYYQKAVEIAKQYMQFLGKFNGSNKCIAFPELLDAVVYFDDIELYALHILCDVLLNRNRVRVKTGTHSANLFPHHLEEEKPKEPMVADRIRHLWVQGVQIENEDKAKALRFIDEAIKLGEDNNVPHTFAKAARLNLTHEDSSELIPSFQNDLQYYLDRDALHDAIQTLLALVYEHVNRGYKQQALNYVDQAQNLLKTKIYSDKPIDRHPDYEGYARIMLRGDLVYLNTLRKKIASA